ncbi:hypothetical protein K3495_g1099 [Podosphaera aphanis]|nr:hypothetical protein K3495_g1099 [Podosphaera aphanis]
MVERQTNNKIKAAGCDNAPELIKAIREWNAKDGVIMQLTTTIAASHQNGPAERTIQTVNADSRAMIKEAELPLEFWNEAAEADCYMRNRTDTGPRINGKRVSPMEAFTGKIPDIDHIRKWGSRCYYFLDRKSITAKKRRDKLVRPGRIGVFMGYSETTTSHYKVYSPERGCTIEVSVLKVDENTKGGTVDLKIRMPNVGSQGTKNEMNDRVPRGRPKNASNIMQDTTASREGLDTTISEDPRDKTKTMTHTNIPEPIIEPEIPIAKNNKTLDKYTSSNAPTIKLEDTSTVEKIQTSHLASSNPNPKTRNRPEPQIKIEKKDKIEDKSKLSKPQTLQI